MEKHQVKIGSTHFQDTPPGVMTVKRKKLNEELATSPPVQSPQCHCVFVCCHAWMDGMLQFPCPCLYFPLQLHPSTSSPPVLCWKLGSDGVRTIPMITVLQQLFFWFVFFFFRFMAPNHCTIRNCGCENSLGGREGMGVEYGVHRASFVCGVSLCYDGHTLH